MKLNLKSVTIGLILGCIVTCSVSVFAYNGTRTIQAAYKNIKIFVDGAELTPRDSTGNVLEPFIYNGSTYLPVRAVAEAVGKDVRYDANTNSVYIGSAGTPSTSTGTPSTSIGSYIEPYKEENVSVTDMSVAGTHYINALLLRSGYGRAVAYYNVGGRFNSMSGLYSSVDETLESETMTLNFYGDDILLKTVEVHGNQLPKNFTINLTGVSQLMVEAISKPQNCNDVVLGEISFK